MAFGHGLSVGFTATISPRLFHGTTSRHYFTIGKSSRSILTTCLKKHHPTNAALARSAKLVKAALSFTANSASTLRSSSMAAWLRPLIKRL